MAGRTKHLFERNGRFIARLVVPKHLREIIGKREFQAALGSDRRSAERRSYAVIAGFQDAIARAQRQSEIEGRFAPTRASRRSSDTELAQAHYREELAIDDGVRNVEGLYADMSWSHSGHRAALRRVASGSASIEEAEAVIGWAVTKFARRENREILTDTSEWFALARTLALVQLEIVSRQEERDEGRYDGLPTLPILTKAPEPTAVAPLKLDDLFAAYSRELEAQGRGSEAVRRWKPVFVDLKKHLRHSDASKITSQNLHDWRDDLVGRLAPRTIANVYFAAVKAVMRWGVDTGRLPSNPASNLRFRIARTQLSREKGFNEVEALSVLTAAARYEPQSTSNAATTESLSMTAAKRWVPWLCAYTGARVAEMTQLRKEDVRTSGGIAFMRLTPDSGSIKSGLYRDVPLHQHLLDRGFLEFVARSDDGPIFYANSPRSGITPPAKTVAGRVGGWLRGLKIFAASVQPNHGWRHRFKSVSLELGLDQRICDAIQGHAARTAGERYGDVSLLAKSRLINAMPRYHIDASSAL